MTVVDALKHIIQRLDKIEALLTGGDLGDLDLGDLNVSTNRTIGVSGRGSPNLSDPNSNGSITDSSHLPIDPNYKPKTLDEARVESNQRVTTKLIASTLAPNKQCQFCGTMVNEFEPQGLAQGIGICTECYSNPQEAERQYLKRRSQGMT